MCLGDIILSKDDVDHVFYVVKSGSVREDLSLANDHTMMGPYTSIGDECLLDEAYHTTYIANEPSTLLVIDSTKLIGLSEEALDELTENAKGKQRALLRLKSRTVSEIQLKRRSGSFADHGVLTAVRTNSQRSIYDKDESNNKSQSKIIDISSVFNGASRTFSFRDIPIVEEAPNANVAVVKNRSPSVILKAKRRLSRGNSMRSMSEYSQTGESSAEFDTLRAKVNLSTNTLDEKSCSAAFCWIFSEQ